LSGWSQVNTALFFHSQPYRDAFVNQFNHLRYFAWTQERDKQLMKTPPKGALTPPADVAVPPAGLARFRLNRGHRNADSLGCAPRRHRR
jgi:hypothetical protein